MFYTCLYNVHNKQVHKYAYVDLYGYFNHSKMREREKKTHKNARVSLIFKNEPYQYPVMMMMMMKWQRTMHLLQ